MAVIARRAVLALLPACLVKPADTTDEALRAINRVSTALAGGDAGGAIDAFDKTCPGYELLAGYFAALVSSFAITSEADVSDEKESGGTVTVLLDWTLTLQSLASGASTQREQQVSVDVARTTSKITRFSPFELFNPA